MDLLLTAAAVACHAGSCSGKADYISLPDLIVCAVRLWWCRHNLWLHVLNARESVNMIFIDRETAARPTKISFSGRAVHADRLLACHT